MNIRNGTRYESNYARAAASFLGTCAPAPEGRERLAAYELITGVYAAIAENPAVLGVKPLPDAAFTPWEQQKGREKDIKNIRGPIAKIESLMAELSALAEGAEALPEGALLAEGAKPSRALKGALNAVGAPCEARGERVAILLKDGCLTGLKELSAISRANTVPITDSPMEDKTYLYFSRCVFEPAQNWTARAFDQLLDANGEFLRLCGEMEKRGYTRTDCVDGKKISVDYWKQLGKKPEPLKLPWAEKTHLGISASFEELRLEPAFLWVRMPMFRTVLAHPDQLPESVVRFITSWTKPCDGCRYCVQTDKTHTRPIAAFAFGGKKLCPNFPGFSMNWRTQPPELTDAIITMLDALETLPEFQE